MNSGLQRSETTTSGHQLVKAVTCPWLFISVNSSFFVMFLLFSLLHCVDYISTHLANTYHAKSWLIGEDCDAGRDWGQEEKGTTEDEMAGWHHRLDAHEFGWTLGIGNGQGGLACCNSWGRKESETTERLNWTELNPVLSSFLSISRFSMYIDGEHRPGDNLLEWSCLK